MARERRPGAIPDPCHGSRRDAVVARRLRGRVGPRRWIPRRRPAGALSSGRADVSRVLFVMLHPGFVRYYDDAVQALADAGHDVHLAFEVTRTKLGENVTAQRLAGRSPRLTCGTTPERRESVREFLARGDRSATRSGAAVRGGWQASRDEAWESLRTTVRLLADYLRFFEPAFNAAVKLRARAEKRLPRIYAPVVRAVARRGPTARACLAWAL